MGDTDINIINNNLFSKDYGILWFDDLGDDYIKSFKGVAYSDKNGFFSFDSLEQIDKKIFWWSNLTQPMVFHIGRQKTIKPDDFFGFNLSHLVFLLCASKENFKEVFSYIYVFFIKIIRYYSDTINGEVEIDLSTNLFTEIFFNHNLKKYEDFFDYDCYDNEFLEILKKSYINEYIVNSYASDDYVKVPLILNPLILNKIINNISIPFGSVRFCKNTNSNFSDWLLSQNLFYLAKIENIKFKEKNSLGVIFNRENNLFFQRKFKKVDWYTNLDIEFLKSYATFDIVCAYMFENKKQLTQDFFCFGPISDLSFTKMLICGMQNKSLIDQQYKITERKKYPIMPINVFLNSYIRVYLENILNEINNSGFNIYSYGPNGVVVWAKKEELSKISIIANNHGYLTYNFLSKYLNKDNSFDFLSDNSFEENLQDDDFSYKNYSISLYEHVNFLIEKNNFFNIDKIILPIKTDNIEEYLKQSVKDIMNIKKDVSESSAKLLQQLIFQQIKLTVSYLKNKGKN